MLCCMSRDKFSRGLEVSGLCWKPADSAADSERTLKSSGLRWIQVRGGVRGGAADLSAGVRQNSFESIRNTFWRSSFGLRAESGGSAAESTPRRIVPATGSSAKILRNIVRKFLRINNSLRTITKYIHETKLLLRNFEKIIRESVFREPEFTNLCVPSLIELANRRV